jgi:hypothetical protein
MEKEGVERKRRGWEEEFSGTNVLRVYIRL